MLQNVITASRRGWGRLLKSFTTLRPELNDIGADRPFDPVVAGVANGLARIFPPIHNVHSPEHDDDEVRDGDTSDTDRMGHRTGS